MRRPILAWIFAIFTLLAFLGTRSLNEPDEGRYSTIAAGMLERGDWVVPHLWHVPHLDKPPMTYWLVAASIKVFGRNEWAVRLPLALAALSGTAAAFILARSIAGPLAATWTLLILPTSLLYFVMGRMLTTDIFLAQFVMWAVTLWWLGWRKVFGNPDTAPGWRAFAAYYMAGWACLGLGFLTKGPMSIAWCVAPLCVMGVRGRRKPGFVWKLGGLTLLGLATCLGIAWPWFHAVFQRVPEAFDFMVKGQVMGHALGTTAKHRGGSPLYYVAILGVGLLPWTPFLGCLWRRGWRDTMIVVQRDAYWLLSAAALTGFAGLSFMTSKLPGYILPAFPMVAVLIAWNITNSGAVGIPHWVWRAWAVLPCFVWIGAALALQWIFSPAETSTSLVAQGIVGACLLLALLFNRRMLGGAQQYSLWLCSGCLLCTAWSVTSVETKLRANQTLKPLAAHLKENWQSGDVLLCWANRLPQGLPFYAHPLINATNLPYLAGMNLAQVPFELPGNQARYGVRLLPDAAAVTNLVNHSRRTWVLARKNSRLPFRAWPNLPSPLKVGDWELFPIQRMGH